MKKLLKTGFGLLLIFAAFGINAEIVEKIVAVIGDQVITMSELDKAYKDDELVIFQNGADRDKISKKDYLQRMVEAKLIEEEVKKEGVTVTAQEVEQAIERKRTSMGMSQADFAEALRKQGMTIDEYREQTRKSLVMSRLVSKEVKSDIDITDKDIETYYNQHKAEFIAPDKVRLYHIVIRDAPDAEKRINEIATKFKAGTPFTELAKSLSEGEEASKDGDLGWVALNELRPDISELAGKLQINEMSAVFKDNVGYHLFWVQGREKGGQQTLEDAKDTIRPILMQQQFEEKYKVWLERLKSKTYVDIRL
jgi:peptidyl-prolyl cis-trans isomerase SurA